jgi:hypothetical protein
MKPLLAHSAFGKLEFSILLGSNEAAMADPMMPHTELKANRAERSAAARLRRILQGQVLHLVYSP